MLSRCHLVIVMALLCWFCVQQRTHENAFCRIIFFPSLCFYFQAKRRHCDATSILQCYCNCSGLRWAINYSLKKKKAKHANPGPNISMHDLTLSSSQITNKFNHVCALLSHSTYAFSIAFQMVFRFYLYFTRSFLVCTQLTLCSRSSLDDSKHFGSENDDDDDDEYDEDGRWQCIVSTFQIDRIMNDLAEFLRKWNGKAKRNSRDSDRNKNNALILHFVGVQNGMRISTTPNHSYPQICFDWLRCAFIPFFTIFFLFYRIFDPISKNPFRYRVRVRWLNWKYRKTTRIYWMVECIKLFGCFFLYISISEITKG